MSVVLFVGRDADGNRCRETVVQDGANEIQTRAQFSFLREIAFDYRGRMKPGTIQWIPPGSHRWRRKERT